MVYAMDPWFQGSMVYASIFMTRPNQTGQIPDATCWPVKKSLPDLSLPGPVKSDRLDFVNCTSIAYIIVILCQLDMNSDSLSLKLI